RSYTETFDLLLNDIHNALELLKADPVYEDPNRSDDFYEEIAQDEFYDERELRMNYYAVKALQARVLLWMGGDDNLTNALDAAEEVIDDSPAELTNIDSYNIVRDPILYPELIFALYIQNFDDIMKDRLDATINLPSYRFSKS